MLDFDAEGSTDDIATLLSAFEISARRTAAERDGNFKREIQHTDSGAGNKWLLPLIHR